MTTQRLWGRAFVGGSIRERTLITIEDGQIGEIGEFAQPPADATRIADLIVPGFVDVHCHAFQRALRGRSGGADFWGWRDLMLEEASRQTPEVVRREYVGVYRELRAAGFTAVGEFHYLGLPEAFAAAEAAAEAQIRIVVLLAAYARGGLPRFRQGSVAEYLRQIEDLRAKDVAVGLARFDRVCDRSILRIQVE